MLDVDFRGHTFNALVSSPPRVALVGYSAGGYLALLSAYTEGNKHLPPSCDVEDSGVSAVAAFYPPTDLERLYEMEWPALGQPLLRSRFRLILERLGLPDQQVHPRRVSRTLPRGAERPDGFE
jgi:acetyl esterase/lipase